MEGMEKQVLSHYFIFVASFVIPVPCFFKWISCPCYLFSILVFKLQSSLLENKDFCFHVNLHVQHYSSTLLCSLFSSFSLFLTFVCVVVVKC